MSHGFLGHDASLMLDVVVCALSVAGPLLAVSLWLVRSKSRYGLHKRMQIGLAIMLLAAVAAFEIDLHIIHGGWLNIANKNPESPRLAGSELELARALLHIHLIFAVTTPPLWALTIWLALRRFPDPPRPSAHSRWHARLGWLSAADLVLTSATGIAFYCAAFVVT